MTGKCEGMKIPITEPTIPDLSALRSGYMRILKSRMITNSAFTRELEAEVQKRLKVKHAIAVNSCTSGLMLVMKALGLKGKIVMPSFTFHATAHAAVWNRLVPVFADCDPETFNLDPKSAEDAITSGTSAILAVHIFGNPADVEALARIARKKNVKLIFDAAHGFGSSHKGKPIGSFGDAEVFSLSPTKLVTAGEGGMVTTNDDRIAKSVRMGRNYGDGGNYDCEFSGLSARLSECNALLGLESLKNLEKNVARRHEAVELYKKSLSWIPGISFQKIEKGDRSSCKDFAMLVDYKKIGISRDRLYDMLVSQGVTVKKYFYPPVHKQKTFKRFAGRNPAARLKNTNYISENILSLPLYSHIETATIIRICSTIKDIILKDLAL